MLKKIIGLQVPAFFVVLMSLVGAYVGYEYASTRLNGKFLTVSAKTVVLDAVLSANTQDRELLNKTIVQPYQVLLRKYQDQGYVVIETVTDNDGNMAIVALPKGTKDITNELTEILGSKKGK